MVKVFIQVSNWNRIIALNLFFYVLRQFRVLHIVWILVTRQQMLFATFINWYHLWFMVSQIEEVYGCTGSYRGMRLFRYSVELDYSFWVECFIGHSYTYRTHPYINKEATLRCIIMRLNTHAHWLSPAVRPRVYRHWRSRDEINVNTITKLTYIVF